MKYTLVWLKTAEAELGRIWLASRNQAEIARASDALEKLLATRPLTSGEEVERGIRRISDGPLMISYRVIPDDRLVRVIGVALDE